MRDESTIANIVYFFKNKSSCIYQNKNRRQPFIRPASGRVVAELTPLPMSAMAGGPGRKLFPETQ